MGAPASTLCVSLCSSVKWVELDILTNSREARLGILRGRGPYWTEALGTLASYNYDLVSLPDDVRDAHGLDIMLPDSDTNFLYDYEEHMLRHEEEVERIRTEAGGACGSR